MGRVMAQKLKGLGGLFGRVQLSTDTSKCRAVSRG